MVSDRRAQTGGGTVIDRLCVEGEKAVVNVLIGGNRVDKRKDEKGAR